MALPDSSGLWSVLRSPSVAGLIGGSVGFIAGYPFDVIKSFSQIDQTANMFSSGRSIYRRFGLMGFYNGLLTPLLCRSLVKGTLFGVYGAVMQSTLLWGSAGGASPGVLSHTWVGRQADGTGTAFAKMSLAGAVAAVANSFVASPVELVKLSYQRGVSFFGAVRAESLLSTLTRGLPETICREVPFYMIYYPLHAWCKEALAGTGLAALSGGIAGTVPWVVIYPLDVLKTFRQRPEAATDGQTFADFVRRSGGWRSLTNGLAPTVLRAFPIHFCTLWVYDALTVTSEVPRSKG